VTLTVEPLENPGTDPVFASEPAVVVEPEPEPEPAAVVAPDPVPEVEPAPVAAAPAPRRGFFARLFSKRTPTVAQSDDAEPVTADNFFAGAPAADVAVAVAPDTPAGEAEGIEESAPEAVAGEPGWDPEAVLATLNGTLDHLGFAHHRPFSRG
jgi:hypothetical protein